MCGKIDFIFCNIPDRELFVVKESLIEDNRKEANLYRGKIIVLVNNKTYSGASSFAHVMNKLGIASVEVETGCPTVYFGNFLPFTLPNSKIDYYTQLYTLLYQWFCIMLSCTKHI